MKPAAQVMWGFLLQLSHLSGKQVREARHCQDSCMGSQHEMSERGKGGARHEWLPEAAGWEEPEVTANRPGIHWGMMRWFWN